MRYTIPYTGVNDSLKHLKIQVLESIPYCKSILPDNIKTPAQIFNWCKNRTFYVKDGKNEVFQSVQTLFENNYHGISGAADCDCMTILILSCLAARGYKKIGIVLVGRKPDQAVHIYAYCDYCGCRQYLDLTNEFFNFERYYPFKQHIRFKKTPIKIIFKQ